MWRSLPAWSRTAPYRRRWSGAATRRAATTARACCASRPRPGAPRRSSCAWTGRERPSRAFFAGDWNEGAKLMDMPRHDHSHHDHHGHSGEAAGAQPGTAIDPICGMTVDIATTKHKHSFGATTWYFCSKHCVDKFAADPERYAKGEKAASV